MQHIIEILVLVVVAILAVAAVAVTAVFGGAALVRSRLRRSSRPSGEIIPVSGSRMHVVRRGPDAGPTVVLIAGLGGVAASWSDLIERLGPSVSVVAYDRPGLGWSESARGPRTATVMADELHELLAAAGAPTPYVLVGHSLGGVIARHFAQRHPSLTGGLLLVDSAHEEQYRRMPEVARVVRRMTAMPAPIVRFVSRLSTLKRTGRDSRLSPEAADAVDVAMRVGASHLPTAMAEMRAVGEGTQAPIDDLGDLPLIVLHHGRYERMPMLPPEVNDRYESLFAELQAELVGLSTKGRLTKVPDAGHEIHLDRPEIVVQAIHELLGRAAATSHPASATPPDPVRPVGKPSTDDGEHSTQAAPPLPPSSSWPLGAALAACARPLLVLTGALLAVGSVLAAIHVEIGWVVYLAGYASAALSIPALAAAQRPQLGRSGIVAFSLLTLAVLLATPVVAMVASFVLRLDSLHAALMPYAMSVPGMGAAFGANVILVAVGITIVRAGVLPALVGWLMITAAVIELPVELGVLPLGVWTLAMVMLAAALILAAASLGDRRRPVFRPMYG